jgi:hypothetical protein
VNKTNDRLEIQGRGTFNLTIGDNNGRLHTIPTPNSLYVPGLKICL